MFKDLKVVELASVLAGPAVGMFFAELGSKVIKIENKNTGGDVTRSWKLTSEDPDDTISAYFSSVNYLKEYLFLDLSDPDENNKAMDHIRNADILISNFKPGDEAKFGLSDQELSKLNPRLIHGKIKGYPGESGRPAFDVVLQAESGFLFMNGDLNGPPVKMPVALIDVLAAHQLKEAILIALWQRERSGKGAMVSVSLYDAAITSLVNQASNFLMEGHVPQRMGTLHPNIAPYGEMFQTKDSKLIVLAIGNNKQFKELCELLQLEQLYQKSEFADNPSRVKNRDQLKIHLEKKINQWKRGDLLNQLEKRKIPAGGIFDLQEVFDQDPAKKLIREEIINGKLTRRVTSLAFDSGFIKESE